MFYLYLSFFYLFEQVIATHKYSPEDEDELSFEKGEIIHVIPYDDPEEQVPELFSFTFLRDRFLRYILYSFTERTIFIFFFF